VSSSARQPRSRTSGSRTASSAARIPK
jgi:hypothetical protein